MAVRAAIVGWGDVAAIHAEAISAIDDATIVGIVDTDAARRADAAEELGVPAFATIDALVDAVAPDVVHVTTPHDQHVTGSLAALARGVHVIQEKPLAASLTDAQRLVDWAERASIPEVRASAVPEVGASAVPEVRASASLEGTSDGFEARFARTSASELEGFEARFARTSASELEGTSASSFARTSAGVPKIGICFQNRYNVSSQQVRRLLDSGELGAIGGAYASVVWTRTADYYRAKPWRGSRAQSGGGLLINQAIHTLDLVQWFLGDVVDVTGHVATHKFADVIEVEDTAELLLTHASGFQTSFFATLTAPQHRPVEIELDCEHAYVTLRNGLTVAWKDGRDPEFFAERQAASGGRSYWGVSHELLIRDFYERLDEPEPFWIGPAEAMKSLRLLKRAYDVSGF